MYTYAVGFGALLHVLFWGAGLAMTAMPKRWRRFWPVVAAPAGLALQSLVVWLCTYLGLAGTDAYAWWCEIIPVIWWIVEWRRRGRVLFGETVKFAGLWLVMVAQLSLVLVPFARITRGLTTVSLGSMDAADYAAGARVFKEFAHSDRSGFLGLTEVVRVASADNFYDFWLRLNHFTPSALVAFNGTIFDCQPHELISVFTAVLLTCSLPAVFWLVRAGVRYSVLSSLAVTLLYGFSPITLYAVYHVAMGQLLAAPAIALITWAGVAVWRRPNSRQKILEFGAVLAIAYAVILGSYNFVVIVCLVPAVAYVGGLGLRQGEWRRWANWAAAMLVPLAVTAVVFWGRTAGLEERFRLFRAFDFGWRVPVVTPEGWLGLVANHLLDPLGGALRWGLCALATGAMFVGWWALAKGKPQRAYLAVCLVVTPLVGYAFLYWRGVWAGTNASYDAYKILAVFLPGILGGAVGWLEASRKRTIWWGGVTLVGAAVVAVGTIRETRQFWEQLREPALGVTRELVQLRRLEDDPSIGSLNLLTSDGWSRLWANAALLKLPQYFATHTYEGRLNTPLRGRWDLIGGVLSVELPNEGSRRLGPHLTIVDTRSPAFVRVRFGTGWYDLEQPFGEPIQWRWSRAAATLRVENPQTHALAATLRLELRAAQPERLEVWLAGKRLYTGEIGTSSQKLEIESVVIPPGESQLEFRALGGATTLAGDSRALGMAFYRIDWNVR